MKIFGFLPAASLILVGGLAAAQEALPVGKGEALYQTSSGSATWTSSAAAQPLHPKDVVKAEAGARAVMIGLDGSKVIVHSRSSAVIESWGPSHAVLLVGAGQLEVWAAKKSQFEIRTPVSTGVVYGAALRVLVDPSGATAWDVFEGKVKVRASKYGKVKLAAGEHAGIDLLGIMSPYEYIMPGVVRSLEPRYKGEPLPPAPKPAKVKKGGKTKSGAAS